MADFTSSPMAGEYYDDQHSDYTVKGSSNRLVTLTNIAGAALSLVLIVGIGIWGYKLLVRDVSGIPVVRAASGEMRIKPDDPGGETASHQGLSVNAVAALGTAAAPADRLILAPKPIDLLDEDQVMPAAMVAPVQQEESVQALSEAPILDAEEVIAALESGNVDDIVAQMTAGVAPLSDVGEDSETVVASVNKAVLAEVTEAERQVASVIEAPGVRRSKRPKKRPATRAVITPAALSTASAPAAKTAEANAASLPAGTRLAQLGAFDSPEVAREQWDQLTVRFDAYLSDKTRIVQKATSGGRVFYRLRAMGFEDIADARRFCSALVAQNADCIPVVTR
ncbi:SPOR domain-containing protein [Sulfitobacter sp. F26204]|uniref:SPOR domain-containing protein n=1 Tax=Sulfitobacter sp. F26204 TaxID=2996014 RepID=UPI00225E206B|nr:SPOR domain-containing protein [Sulfitobacter sp. F26204]MCX7559557.1 SPOR domain-containing protein [Sulfitobacter sp. F26204]